MKHTFLLLTAALIATLAACETAHFGHDIASRLASPSFMIKRVIPAGPYALTAYERMHQRNAPATLYIEGDGPDQGDPLWTAFGDMSPSNPVALHLASRDLSKNLVWLARPCQYSGMRDAETECDEAALHDKKFSPETIAAYNEAMDNIKRLYDIRNFHVVGFGGGGAIAAMLAAQRSDVLSLRTVAGTLDSDVAALMRDTSIPAASYNPVTFAGKLASVPQIHYIGGQDHVMPPAVLESYLQAIGPSSCVRYLFIQTAGHDTGWVSHWPELLVEKPVCAYEPHVIDMVPYTPHEPAFTTREQPEKP